MKSKAFSSWTVFVVFTVACLCISVLYSDRDRDRDSLSLPSSPSTVAEEAVENIEENQNSPNLTDMQGDPLPRGAIARLGTVRLRPLSVDYECIAFSPDGKTLVSDGISGLCLWDAATGKRVDWFHDTFPAVAVCFSPDGKTLIACDDVGTLRRWQVGTGKLLHESKQPKDPKFQGVSGFFSADGTTYGVAFQWGTEQEIRLWEVATGKPLLRWEPKVQRYPSAALSPDGKLLAAGGARNLVHLIETATGKEVQRIEGPIKIPDNDDAGRRNQMKERVHWFTFAQDGRLLAGATRHSLCVWDVATGKLRYQIKSSQGRAAFSPDAKYLACGNEKGIRLYEIASGKEVHCLDPSYCHFHPAAFSPDGKTLAALGGTTIRLWDAATGKPRHDFPGHRHGVSCLAFSPDGTSLASGDADKYGEEGTAIVWDLATGKPRHALAGHVYGVMSLACSPDSKLLASGDGDEVVRSDLQANIRIWDLQSGQFRREFVAHLNKVQSLAFSPNGKMLVSAGSDRRVKLWDVDSGKRLRQIRSEENLLKSVAFSSDGKLLVVADQRGEVAAWNLDSRQKVPGFDRPVPQSQAISPRANHLLSPDGKTLAIVGDNVEEPSIQLVDMETGKRLSLLRGHTGGAITVLAFSPDSRILASGGKDTTVLLWDVSRARLKKWSKAR